MDRKTGSTFSEPTLRAAMWGGERSELFVSLIYMNSYLLFAPSLTKTFII